MSEETIVKTDAIEPSTSSVETKSQPVESSAKSEARASAADEYVPNYKYKVYDEEREFEDWIKPFINKDTEEKFRSLFSKAGAVDIMTSKRERQQKEFENISNNYNKLVSQLKTLSDYVNNGDLDSFFKAIGLPEETVLQYIWSKLQYEKLSPEQRAVYDEYIDLKRQNYELAQRQQILENAWQQQIVNRREEDLNRELSKPHVQAIAQAFDNKMQRKGAFRDEVIRHALAEWNINGVDISAAEAVESVVKKLGVVGQPTPNEAPTIPNVSSRNMSPVGKKPRSFDELRKLAAQLKG